MSDFVNYVVKLLGKECPLWASVDIHHASLIFQRVQHWVFYLVGHPSRYEPRPPGLNFGEQTETGIFPLVIAVA